MTVIAPIKGHVLINQIMCPLEHLNKKDIKILVRDYPEILEDGVPRFCHIEKSEDEEVAPKFYLFPYPRDNFNIRLYLRKNMTLETTAFECEKYLTK